MQPLVVLQGEPLNTTQPLVILQGEPLNKTLLQTTQDPYAPYAYAFKAWSCGFACNSPDLHILHFRDSSNGRGRLWCGLGDKEKIAQDVRKSPRKDMRKLQLCEFDMLFCCM